MSSKKTESFNALSVVNTKLAACMHSLGFIHWKADAIQPEHGGPMNVNFMFSGGTVRPEFQTSCLLGHAKALLSGKLEKVQPMHPFCITMRGQNNHDMLAMAATGIPVKLAGVAGGQMTTYVRGALDPDFLHPNVKTVPVDDLDLAAALGGVGLPVVRIEGTYPHFRFHVARFGYALTASAKEAPPVLEDALHLIRRSPTAQDPLKLALELENPLHPVCLIYEALFARAIFKRQLERVTPLLLLGGGQKLQALVTMNATGRVMEKANRHLKAPPVQWRE